MKPQILSVLLTGLASVPAADPGKVPPGGVATSPVLVVTPAWVNELSLELQTNHPALRAADARTNAAYQNLRAIRTWEDPMARVGGMIAEEEMRAEDGDLIYGVEQKLPLFGKPKVARTMAAAEVSMEEARGNFAFQTLRRDLARAAFRAALADEEVEIARQDLVWLTDMVQVVENRYQAGQALLSEVLTLQNERSRRQTLLSNDLARAGHERFTLNRMLGREQDSPFPPLRLPPLAGPVVYNQRLVDFAFRYEPRLEVFRRELRVGEAAVAVARKERLPEVSLEAEGRNYTGNGDFRQGMVGVSVSLPWFNGGKYKSQVRREEARLKAVEFEREDYRLALREELHDLVRKIDAARREAVVYDNEIIPRSQSALESARAGWESGRALFREVLEARRMLLEARLMRARAAAEQYDWLSDLVLCCGLGDLEALAMIGAAPDGEPKPNAKPDDKPGEKQP